MSYGETDPQDYCVVPHRANGAAGGVRDGSMRRGALSIYELATVLCLPILFKTYWVGGSGIHGRDLNCFSFPGRMTRNGPSYLDQVICDEHRHELILGVTVDWTTDMLKTAVMRVP